jgi:hypothetical protein
MVTKPRDTTDQAWAVVDDGLRRMTPGERVRRAVALTILAHRLALAQIRRRHPEEDERQHRLRLAARYLDAGTMQAAFGWPR